MFVAMCLGSFHGWRAGGERRESINPGEECFDQKISFDQKINHSGMVG